jgi:hypothetical protein
MRVPQVSERLKEVPAQALRGVFAGIGQLLLITDKLRNKAAAGTGIPRARTPEPAETVPPQTVTDTAPTPAPAAPAAPAQREAAEPVAAETPRTPKAPRAPRAPRTAADPQDSATASAPKIPVVPKARDFDKTGNVRLLGGDDAAARAAGKTSKGSSTAAESSAAEEASAGGDASVVAEAREEPGDSGAPLPNFDELSIASLRARLRNLDIAQVRRILEYERGHAARADVITMFERRIAKLEAEG